MFPIQSHTVHLVLQYISPPSLLTEPLPPHLLSRSLLQRHHFLQISPDNPLEYLCWPSPQSARAIELLNNAFTSPSDQPKHYHVRYTSDSEHTYAHVQVVLYDEGVRMLFEWDDEDGWKYHDSQLMPFPSTSRSVLEPASSTVELERRPAVTRGFLDDEDHYWNAYSAPLIESISALAPRSAFKDGFADGTEDAYWAQYSSVQGSADSTVPSPLPNHRKLQTAPSTYYTQQDEAILIPADSIHSLPLPDSKFGPPSPTKLAHLLNIISPRKGTYTPTSNEPPSAFDRDTPSPLSTLDDSDLVTPASGNPGQDAHVASSVKVNLNDLSYSNGRHAGNEQGDEDGDQFAVEEDKAVTESIKGIYYLWRARKWNQPDEESSDAFLRIVRAAVAQP